MSVESVTALPIKSDYLFTLVYIICKLNKRIRRGALSADMRQLQNSKKGFAQNRLIPGLIDER